MCTVEIATPKFTSVICMTPHLRDGATPMLWCGMADGAVWTICTKTDDVVSTFDAHKSAVTAIAVLGADVWTASSTGNIRCWQVQSPPLLPPPPPLAAAGVS